MTKQSWHTRRAANYDGKHTLDWLWSCDNDIHILVETHLDKQSATHCASRLKSEADMPLA